MSRKFLFHIKQDDFSEYVLEPAVMSGRYYVSEEKPSDHPYFWWDEEDTRTVGGREYVRVNWGEDEKSYLPREEIGAVVYLLYLSEGPRDREGNYLPYQGRPFRTREEAERAAKEVIRK